MSEGAQFAKVHGGVITDQMLQGKLRFFSVGCGTAPFSHTISGGDVIIPDMPDFGGVSNIVGVDRPVPGSAAEIAFEVITQRCTVVQIILVSANVIHFVVENDSFAWGDGGTPAAEDEMQAALRALPDLIIPNTTPNGRTINFNADALEVNEFLKFKLA